MSSDTKYIKVLSLVGMEILFEELKDKEFTWGGNGTCISENDYEEYYRRFGPEPMVVVDIREKTIFVRLEEHLSPGEEQYTVEGFLDYLSNRSDDLEEGLKYYVNINYISEMRKLLRELDKHNFFWEDGEWIFGGDAGKAYSQHEQRSVVVVDVDKRRATVVYDQSVIVEEWISVDRFIEEVLPGLEEDSTKDGVEYGQGVKSTFYVHVGSMFGMQKLITDLYTRDYLWDNDLWVLRGDEEGVYEGPSVAIVDTELKILSVVDYAETLDKPWTSVDEFVDEILPAISQEIEVVSTKDGVDFVSRGTSDSGSPDNENEERVQLLEEHRDIIEHLHDVYRRKNHDYGNSFGETYKRLGIISSVTRISDKYNRLESLVTKDKQEVNDEALEDTALDLANYAIMLAMELERDKE